MTETELASFGARATGISCGVLLVVAGCIVFVCDKEQRRENFLMNLKLNVKVLFGMWIVNLIVFTSCLWLGAYAVHSGVKWIEGPVDTTLISTGMAKVILSALLFVAMSEKKVERGGE